MAYFQGVARKLALPFIALTGVGWFLVVIGFGIGSNEDKDEHPYFLQFGPNDRDDPSSYPFWVVCFSGPLIITAAVLHAALQKPYSTILGIVAAFLSVIFLTALGMILYDNGEVIREAHKYDDDDDVPKWFNLEFAGAFIATLFWTPVMILWHLYDVPLNGYHSLR